jgi:hypothetical protein
MMRGSSASRASRLIALGGQRRATLPQHEIIAAGYSCAHFQRMLAFASSTSSSTTGTSAGAQQRSFMSTQPLDSPAPEYESQMMLILGKPGGGKGTISGKILEVRSCGLLLVH